MVVVEKGTVTSTTADGTAVDYPAGSAFFEAKGLVHRTENKGTVDAVALPTFAVAGGPPAETPLTVFVPDPTTKLAAQPTSQGLTLASIGRGAGNLKTPLNIEAGKTDLRVSRLTMAPGGYVSWHYHNGPTLVVVEKGTFTITQADGTTVDYPAGSAFFKPKGTVHRDDNKGNVDAVILPTFAIAGGPPAETPPIVFVPDPTTR
jgi:quercetin dioxygenase-like cupin family protein